MKKPSADIVSAATQMRWHLATMADILNAETDSLTCHPVFDAVLASEDKTRKPATWASLRRAMKLACKACLENLR